MKQFTGWQYLLIDVSNQWGLDKEVFETRIQWAEDNLADLESLAQMRGSWKEKPMYLKAVMAVRKAQQGIPSGHMVGFDAVCSGMQLMAVLTGCKAGAKATGLIDPDRRADAYTDCTDIMIGKLGYHLDGERAKVKNAVMTSLYGSKKEPKKEFGEDTPELNAFYEAMFELAPGPCQLLQVLLESWQPYALTHEWRLPDGFHARVKVMQKESTRIHVDELNGASFTYEYFVNQGEKKGVKNSANVVHSLDAYVLRSLVRRCNYDRQVVEQACGVIQTELLERMLGFETEEAAAESEEVAYYRGLYERSDMVDPVILPYLDESQVTYLSPAHLKALSRVVHTMLDHPPFPIITVHDDFKCHPNHMNELRMHYRDILAELADSTVLDDILSQIHGRPGTFTKLSSDLAQDIEQSAYALC